MHQADLALGGVWNFFFNTYHRKAFVCHGLHQYPIFLFYFFSIFFWIPFVCFSWLEVEMGRRGSPW